MDRGVWWAMVQKVAKRWTRLKWLSTQKHTHTQSVPTQSRCMEACRLDSKRLEEESLEREQSVWWGEFRGWELSWGNTGPGSHHQEGFTSLAQRAGKGGDWQELLLSGGCVWRGWVWGCLLPKSTELNGGRRMWRCSPHLRQEGLRVGGHAKIWDVIWGPI